jgi:hypothetical protein
MCELKLNSYVIVVVVFLKHALTRIPHPRANMITISEVNDVAHVGKET